MKKQRKMVLEFISVLLIPFALFWTLYRYGFLKIIDVLAIAVLIVVGAWWLFRFLMTQKIFTFRRKG